MKSVIVIDTPKTCRDCSLSASYQRSSMSYSEEWCPAGDNKDVDFNSKPDWCPLKALPEIDENEYKLVYSVGYQRGWNDCVKSILSGFKEVLEESNDSI